MTTYTHDINLISCVIGEREVTDLAAGNDSIGIEYESDDISVTKGARGDMQVAAMHDESGTITIKTLSGSSMNGYLSQLRARQKARLQPTSISIFDGNTGRSFFCENCFIKKHPTTTYGDAAQDSLEWTITFTEAVDDWPDDVSVLLFA